MCLYTAHFLFAYWLFLFDFSSSYMQDHDICGITYIVSDAWDKEHILMLYIMKVEIWKTLL